jgi:hypothetical protein
VNKIIFLTEKLDFTAEKLISSLAEQQHEILVISSADQIKSLPAHVECCFAMKRWNFLEIARLMPKLLMFKPEIIHFLIYQQQMNSAQFLIAALSKALPNVVCTVSLMSEKLTFRPVDALRYLVQSADVVTGSSVESLGQLRGLKIHVPQQGRSVLSPFFSLKKKSNAKTNKKIDLKNSYVAMPFQAVEFDSSQRTFKLIEATRRHRPILLIGSTNHWPSQQRKLFEQWMENQNSIHPWLLSKSDSFDFLEYQINCETVLLAGLTLSTSALSDSFRGAILAKKTLIIDHIQAMIHPKIWKKDVNCWMLNEQSVLTELSHLLCQPDLRLEPIYDSLYELEQQLVDEPINELNRMHHKALSLKSIL